eukprot:TRINITY_DN4573_c0_g1_i5.p1 TRINITY_DN4573_c0_g1~~TRINITY_DN4573_c0_g1_i5.p1  ORF type:complete len:510 (+),score=200.67 TRINITY_DN4573_c0_g1_i5:102-1532(+)
MPAQQYADLAKITAAMQEQFDHLVSGLQRLGEAAAATQASAAQHFKTYSQEGSSRAKAALSAQQQQAAEATAAAYARCQGILAEAAGKAQELLPVLDRVLSSALTDQQRAYLADKLRAAADGVSSIAAAARTILTAKYAAVAEKGHEITADVHKRALVLYSAATERAAGARERAVSLYSATADRTAAVSAAAREQASSAYASAAERSAAVSAAAREQVSSAYASAAERSAAVSAAAREQVSSAYASAAERSAAVSAAAREHVSSAYASAAERSAGLRGAAAARVKPAYDRAHEQASAVYTVVAERTAGPRAAGLSAAASAQARIGEQLKALEAVAQQLRSKAEGYATPAARRVAGTAGEWSAPVVSRVGTIKQLLTQQLNGLSPEAVSQLSQAYTAAAACEAKEASKVPGLLYAAFWAAASSAVRRERKYSRSESCGTSDDTHGTAQGDDDDREMRDALASQPSPTPDGARSPSSH